eukprot:4323669-Prymnesium_polylepis.2
MEAATHPFNPSYSGSGASVGRLGGGCVDAKAKAPGGQRRGLAPRGQRRESVQRQWNCRGPELLG